MEEHHVSADGVTYELPEPILRRRHSEPAASSRHLPAAGIAA